MASPNTPFRFALSHHFVHACLINPQLTPVSQTPNHSKIRARSPQITGPTGARVGRSKISSLTITLKPSGTASIFFHLPLRQPQNRRATSLPSTPPPLNWHPPPTHATHARETDTLRASFSRPSGGSAIRVLSSSLGCGRECGLHLLLGFKKR